MDEKKKVDYASAGVNLEAADEALERIKKLAKATFNDRVKSDIGAFGGLFKPNWGEYDDPILVSSMDGVGTKLKLAFISGEHRTVGQDLVNHCVNDILVQGARPLFFMDYIGVGRLKPGIIGDVVEGLSTACCENGMPLLGGETAELPGFYGDGEYDLAGNIIGMVDRRRIVDGSAIKEGDIILGLPSTGLHTNGFSLARKICFEIAGLEFDSRVDGLDREIGKELMTVHKSYLKPVGSLLDVISRGAGVHPAGMAHITGGGIEGNLIRIIPDNLRAIIKTDTWPRLPIFSYMQNAGGVDEADMFEAFNMGIGYIIVIRASEAGRAEQILADNGQNSFRIGHIEKGERSVRLV